LSLKSVKTLTAAQIAKKWNLSLDTVKHLIDAGAKVEKEHTGSLKDAKEIARDHLSERPDYIRNCLR
jgi:orotate phosphoribosyltransferase-like protein